MLTLAIALSLAAAPPELGAIHFERSRARAFALAREKNLPLLVLFTEVPGCSTVNAFAREALENPLLVEAAETLFVPLAIFNNVGGDDAAALAQYGEPAWNNPVVRVLSPTGGALAPRLTHERGAQGLQQVMVQALTALGRPVPAWLALAAPATAATATFQMGCFWEGEARLGGVEGVSSSRTGYLEGAEVVEVSVDGPAALARVEAQAKALGYRPREGRLAPSLRDDQKQLEGSRFAKLPLTPAQRSHLNAALGRGEDPRPLLSPRQRALLERPSTGG
jgi:hypothetical protein